MQAKNRTEDFSSTFPEAVEAQGAAPAACEDAGVTRAVEHALRSLACEHLRVSPIPRKTPDTRMRLEILIRTQPDVAGSLPAEVARRLAGIPIAYLLIISCARY